MHGHKQTPICIIEDAWWVVWIVGGPTLIHPSTLWHLIQSASVHQEVPSGLLNHRFSVNSIKVSHNPCHTFSPDRIFREGFWISSRPLCEGNRDIQRLQHLHFGDCWYSGYLYLTLKPLTFTPGNPALEQSWVSKLISNQTARSTWSTQKWWC